MRGAGYLAGREPPLTGSRSRGPSEWSHGHLTGTVSHASVYRDGCDGVPRSSAVAWHARVAPSPASPLPLFGSLAGHLAEGDSSRFGLVLHVDVRRSNEDPRREIASDSFQCCREESIIGVGRVRPRQALRHVGLMRDGPQGYSALHNRDSAIQGSPPQILLDLPDEPGCLVAHILVSVVYLMPVKIGQYGGRQNDCEMVHTLKLPLLDIRIRQPGRWYPRLPEPY